MTASAHSAPVTGAEALLIAARAGGVELCLANPGTTEMPLVAALDRVPGIRAVLGLQENVCTGAADGYARVTGRPALTLLHLGPGLANGLANLHNARRAGSPVVNVVGDQASWHLPFDAPLTSDIAALAATVGTVHQADDRAGIGDRMLSALDDAGRLRGVSTLIVPADRQQECAPEPPVPAPARPTRPQVDPGWIRSAAARLRGAGPRALLLLGGNALSGSGQAAAARIAAAVGASLYCETFPARVERGGGLPGIDRLPYFPEAALGVLQQAEAVVLAGAREPIAYFGYQGLPSELATPSQLCHLANPRQDAEHALLELAELLGAQRPHPVAPATEVPPDDAPLTGESVGALLAAQLPDGAIVSVEGGTSGYPFFTASATAAPHTVLTNTGGAIGQGLPCALGAALAAPDRRVIALQSDGSALYTAQALWTMSREQCKVTVLIAANHAYGVLRTELQRHGSSPSAPQASALTSLDDPRVDWVALARGFGVPATRAGCAAELRRALTEAAASGGPFLVEMVL